MLNERLWTSVVSKDGAAMVRGGADDAEWECIELVVDSKGLPRLPVNADQTAASIEVRRAVEKYRAAKQERDRLEHLNHEVNVHRPKCRGCPVCMESKIQKGDGVRAPSLKERELEVAIDIIGPLPTSNNGNEWELVGTSHMGVTAEGWSPTLYS